VSMETQTRVASVVGWVVYVFCVVNLQASFACSPARSPSFLS
jgi:hypothetical protein